ncbi:2-hydroxyacid dehydrogenase [Roseomonas sp. BN140053]|uniref:2-hydroxyacid dehydrogenase n=1 Tax=Roseomonas sp. BN140053 TaxID=3391898 RepID=UPI0039EC9AE5
MNPGLLLLIDLAPASLQRLEAAGYHVHRATPAAHRAEGVAAAGAQVRAVLTNGTTGLSAAEMAQLPALEIACALGAGYEGIDLDAAAARGIAVVNGAGTNDSTVADHAMALLLAAVRAVPQGDVAARGSGWATSRDTRPSVSGKRLGVLGLGRIGAGIARRGAGGFGMTVRYHNRSPVADSPWEYCATPRELAAASDFLVVATPGGAGTRHLVDAAVLEALGPQGFLVNIARGSVVDTAALITALEAGRLAGAALDVVEGEPEVPPAMVGLRNLVLTPHMAGRSPESAAASVGLVLDNLAAHFAGQPLRTPVLPARR